MSLALGVNGFDNKTWALTGGYWNQSFACTRFYFSAGCHPWKSIFQRSPRNVAFTDLELNYCYDYAKEFCLSMYLIL
jgi:hypothetical protein